MFSYVLWCTSEGSGQSNNNNNNNNAGLGLGSIVDWMEAGLNVLAVDCKKGAGLSRLNDCLLFH